MREKPVTLAGLTLKAAAAVMRRVGDKTGFEYSSACFGT